MSAVHNQLVLSMPTEGRSTTTANDYGVLKIDSDSTCKTSAIPYSWNGREVAMRSFTNNVTIGCSKNSSALVSNAVAAASPGASVQVGMTLVAGEVALRRLPTWFPHETMYFVHQAAVDNTVLEVSLVG